MPQIGFINAIYNYWSKSNKKLKRQIISYKITVVKKLLDLIQYYLKQTIQFNVEEENTKQLGNCRCFRTIQTKKMWWNIKE